MHVNVDLVVDDVNLYWYMYTIFFLVGDVAFVDIIEDSHGKSKVQKPGESFNLFLICIPVVET